MQRKATSPAAKTLTGLVLIDSKKQAQEVKPERSGADFTNSDA